MYVLFKHSDSFNKYVIASSSPWWDDGVIYNLEEKFPDTHTNPTKKVFLSFGSKELTGGHQEMIDTILVCI